MYLIGVPGKLMEQTEKIINETGQDVEQFVKTFLKAENNRRSEQRGGKTFEGNQAMKLLSKAGNLMDYIGVQTEDVQKKISDISKTLVKFKVVVDQCFGVKLFPGYIHAIEEFCSSYRLLHNITFPTKYHIVETHIIQYLDRRGDGTKGLGYWSEQAMESCHHDFKEFWSLTKVDQDHPNFAERLLSTIIKYNSSHI